VKDGKPFWYYFDAFVAFKKKSQSSYVYRDYHYSLRKHLKASAAASSATSIVIQEAKKKIDTKKKEQDDF
jgi:hypothetical protein